MRPLRGEKLMIVSNGAAPAALALDELWRRFGKLATLSEETLQRLKEALPTSVTPGNPLDLRDDASSDRYIKAISILLDSQDFDALMIIHSPSAVAPGSESARALIEAVRNHPRGKYVTLLTNWCGEFSSQEARRLFSEAGCQPTARRKAPSPRLCIWWNIAVTRNSSARRRPCPGI